MSSGIFTKPVDLAKSAPRLHGSMVFEALAIRCIMIFCYFLFIPLDLFRLVEVSISKACWFVWVGGWVGVDFLNLCGSKRCPNLINNRYDYLHRKR